MNWNPTRFFGSENTRRIAAELTRDGACPEPFLCCLALISMAIDSACPDGAGSLTDRAIPYVERAYRVSGIMTTGGLENTARSHIALFRLVADAAEVILSGREAA